MAPKMSGMSTEGLALVATYQRTVRAPLARIWMHNGFVQVNSEKMSKSLGNIFTVRELLDEGFKGEAMRLALLGAQMAEHDGLVAFMRFHVLAGPVRVERGTHRRKQVGAPPHAGVHRQGNGDVMPPEQPRRRVALTGVILALSRHGCMTARGRNAVIRIVGKGRCMHIDGGRGHEAMFVHHADTVVFGDAPHTSVGCHRQVKVTRDLEGGPPDLQAGHELAKKTCFVCHKLNGEGAEVGPDLTGVGRSTLDAPLRKRNGSP